MGAVNGGTLKDRRNYFKMKYKTAVGLVLLSLIVSNEALRILVCYPMTSKSHSILGHGVVNRLLEAGHEVTHITSFPRGIAHPNLREVNVSRIAEAFLEDKKSTEEFALKNMVGKGNFAESVMFLYYVYLIHKNFLEFPSVVELFSDPNEKFDAVILEWFFTELNSGIPALFDCPLIWVCSTEPDWHAFRIMDGITNPAYSLDLFTHYTLPLSFWQRAEGLYKLVKKNLQLLVFYQFEKWTYNSYYPAVAAKRGVTMPPYEEAVYNGSLMFLNAHPSIGGAMKLPQNTVNIAGYHIDKTKPLPQDLQKLMDEAKDGVIYFSMGSILESSGMSENMKRSLLNMFSKYKQTVIWKFETDLTGIPDNVHLVKWAPQTSILAHPNLRLFITHGGQLSTSEAIHYGVPVVGLPVMADQVLNMKSTAAKGFGIHVTISEDMYEDLDTAVRKVLDDKTYAKKAKELSALFHDREMPPGKAVPYWVEYIVRNRGAPHLRSPALHVPLYQKLYLDLAVVLTIIIVLITKAVKYILGCRSKEQKKEKSS
ncbi:hypothetical protein PYW07_009125 [Mythimna separata]|uniref:UDP-glucuronosyltransferase n=1 Tax=Mythimna separata TaxID=271217 RepID=A0AAD8DMA6_MYTSE|nr:hypothetical protein PYW07_009125 [Mythimna separata]